MHAGTLTLCSIAASLIINLRVCVCVSKDILGRLHVLRSCQVQTEGPAGRLETNNQEVPASVLPALITCWSITSRTLFSELAAI